MRMQLRNIDPDDVADVLMKVQKTFDFKFGDTELRDVKTFGELCDIITAKVQGDDVENCTTQQGFYKLRNAIAATLLIDKHLITPATALQQLFPRHHRRQNIKNLQHKPGISVDMLDIKKWLGRTIFIGIISSLVMFFFRWEFALGGLVAFIAIGWTANKFFAKELKLTTVGQLAEKLTRENYRKSRRDSATINRNEIAQKVKELFQHDLGLESSVLTREATF